MKGTCILFAIILLGILPVNTVCAEEAQFSDGLAQIAGKGPDGFTVEIAVKTSKYSSSVPYRHGFIWGALVVPDNPSPEYPLSVITSIDVRVDNKKIFVPLSAYSDLANPNTLSLEMMPNEFRLILIGGDAGTSYKAVLVFENWRIQRRKVIDSEFPDEAWEETVYSFIDSTTE